MILPRPASGFAWAPSRDRWALVCHALEPLARHAFTARSWRLGSTAGEDAWREVAEAVDAEPAHLLRLRQVHGADVVVHRALQPAPAGAAADIIVGDDETVAMAIQTADCVPLLIGDMRSGAVAAAHAGWRGTASRVATAAVAAMTRELGSRPGDLVAAVGPSIGPCCYEVGEDVRARFAREAFAEAELTRWFHAAPRQLPANPPMIRETAAQASRGVFLDLWSATRDQLESAGVASDRIFVAELCTASHPGTFCSYRRDGTAAGRLAAVIRGRGTNIKS